MRKDFFKKIVFVVTDPKEQIYDELREVLSLLSARGVEVVVASYLDEDFDWSSCDLINFNACVKYYRNVEKFSDFCNKILQLKIKTTNPIPAVLWNLEKKYLLDLASAGFPCADTLWIEKNQECDLQKECAKRNWKTIIVKPSLSAGSFNTAVFSSDEILNASKHLEKVSKDSSVMVQEFMSEINEVGEYSAIFLNKKFSHLVLKTPAIGDFRAGIRQNASAKAINEEEGRELIGYAKKIVDHVKEDLLYARVDLIIARNQIYLMELELIEPLLYSQFAVGFAEKYVEAIRQIY